MEHGGQPRGRGERRPAAAVLCSAVLSVSVGPSHWTSKGTKAVPQHGWPPPVKAERERERAAEEWGRALVLVVLGPAAV